MDGPFTMAASQPDSGTPMAIAEERVAQNHAINEKTSDDSKEEVEDPLESGDGDSMLSRKDSRTDYEPINVGDDEVLHRLATQMSRRESVYSKHSKPGHDDLITTNPALDPSSPQFDLKKYIQNAFQVLDESGVKLKRAGVVFKDVNVRGSGSAWGLQGTVSSMFITVMRPREWLPFGNRNPRHILHDFDGIMKAGELLVVLGRPGSGCSTLLKTICGETAGLELDEKSIIHFNGIEREQMIKEFRGEVVYNQEVDKHFPHLTVGETLEHAAALRMAQNRPSGLSRNELIKHLTQVIMAVYGLSHTYNTKVGNDFVRGVSGGERKRVSIAEMALAGSPVAAWDNSTRGLDSATALSFVKSLRLTANILGSTSAVAIYQASQAIFDLFDKAVVLYEGREIYFGPTNTAKQYFENQGWYCPRRQTTGDFLTSVTNPSERTVREGFENKVPRTAEEFEKYWKESPEYAKLHEEIRKHEEDYPVGNKAQLEDLRKAKNEQQAHHVRPKSPYVVSTIMQVRYNVYRAWRRIVNDKASTLTPLIGNIVMALIIGSVYFGTPNATAGFQSKGAALFFAVLLNALTAIAEINSLYAQRPIVEKHKSYAFYHPWTEALAGMVMDIPLKFAQAVVFNIILYFLAGLRKEAGPFFLFFLIVYISTFVMSAVFRTMAAVTKTVSQAMALAGVLVLAIVVYTGFVVPIPFMHPWFSWIRWINPVFYAFEILVANEFHGVDFTCSQFVPAYADLSGDAFVCSQTGAIAGQRTVNGDTYIAVAYNYSYSHVWRNFGILIAFLIGFMAMYFVAVELNSSTTSTAEVLVFRRGHVPKALQDSKSKDDEKGDAQGAGTTQMADKDTVKNVLPEQKDIFTWRDVVYDIEIKGEPRRLLDHVNGWVRPGTLTALMGTSGAGKTTLLDVLAQRTTMGVITGDMFVNGKPLAAGFQRNTGYVQQQDLHLDTSTVRESLRFSAMLRQPKTVSRKEKYEYVESVIEMLGMEEFAEAVVGVPGEGLNVEQRKLLTIGVELAAKPKLLLFLDEPTSGLDSQSSWAICAFLRKLADSGQAVLCTIHQPSAILFEQFDRLLFLRKGGQTVYFGDIGKHSRVLLDYFEHNGARKFDEDENPAEYMLEVAGDKDHDWHETWKNSQEAKDVLTGIEKIHSETQHLHDNDDGSDASMSGEFAMPFAQQVREVTVRVFQQYWRMPSYIIAKFALSALSGLFIGFSFFNADSSLQGMQIVLYSLFMVSTIFSTIVQQVMPLFVTQRSLYEVRERPSKTYSWKAFLMANIVVEWPYQIFTGVILYACFYYPVVGVQESERQGLVLLMCIALMIYASTFAHLCIVALPDAQTAGSIVTLLFSMSLTFNGVLQSPDALPGFWIFMYRVSPFTYWVGGISLAMLYGREIQCSPAETNIFNPPSGMTCGAYLQPYISGGAPGQLLNADATTQCEYCPLTSANQFLAGVEIFWPDRWRDFGLMWAYIGFDVLGAIWLYWFFRVRKSGKSSGKSKISVGAKVKMIGESVRNRYKTINKVNKGNAEVF
ncbi:Hypothetical protein R9X50_00559700 [Acrodontium crateriforme]|uniref:ABC transporter domain-containing protein n=1 Tax=Acrodontium crateriforme TaxID=150365 RepID=A0AAQ3R985_9PEZI|nr:Hypothetical protein R9X50_00559700 [Acrodontium crateriforme]